MVEKEYLSVAEIAKQKGMTTRNVRRLITQLSETKNNNLLRKNKFNRWEIHHLLEPKFRRMRNRKQKYFALSFKTYKIYSQEDIKLILKNVFNKVDDPDLEINYTIENKKSNEQPHVHSFIKTNNKKNELFRTLDLLFANMSYHESKIFDLERWKQYITKDGSPIITLKK
ncbi:hypothetical protein [Galbibacter sp.]|uniref:hypothetical protein n=1 Tax=Galbibacter sp. TaxID=2918471 RepID=UPI003A8DCD27